MCVHTSVHIAVSHYRCFKNMQHNVKNVVLVQTIQFVQQHLVVPHCCVPGNDACGIIPCPRHKTPFTLMRAGYQSSADCNCAVSISR